MADDLMKLHLDKYQASGATAPNVWALGECAGSPYFTHVSEDDFSVVDANLNGGNRSTRDRLIPYCVFTDPPLGRVGVTESQARANNIAYRVASLPMDAVPRTGTLSETSRFMKVVIGRTAIAFSGSLLSDRKRAASKLISNVQIAMLLKQPYTLLRDAVFIHPTITQGLGPLFAHVPKRRDAAIEKREYAGTSAHKNQTNEQSENVDRSLSKDRPSPREPNGIAGS
jgi:pyruvate/2-oxoglutarate dehydrogenase complex dihydrolipoamide dehydrogenase (E3) component